MSDIDPFDPRRFRLGPGKPTPVARRMQRSSVPFARSLLPWLTDRRWDAIYPPRTRLWLLLLIKSKEGRDSVRLTNSMAAEIGLDRHAKARALAQLKRVGLISVTQTGHKVPIVAVLAAFNPGDGV